MKTIKITLLLIASTIFFSSCNFNINTGKEGNGNVVKEMRNASEDFDEIIGNRGLEIILTKGETNSIEVESDENLQKHIKTSISDGRLEITTDENLSGSATKKIYVTFKLLKMIDASSGAEIDVKGQLKNEILTLEASSGAAIEADIFSKEINVKTSSGAQISVSGKASQLIAKASSGGNIRAKDLTVATAKADASSGGDITVTVQDRLDSEASSGGQISYYGNPQEINSNNSSSGSINKM